MKRLISIITTLAIIISTVIPVSADTTVSEQDRILVSAEVCSQAEKVTLSNDIVVGSYFSPCYSHYGKCSWCGTEDTPKSYYATQYYCACGKCYYNHICKCSKCGRFVWGEHYAREYVCSVCGSKPTGCHYRETNYGYEGTESTFYEQKGVKV